MIRENDLVVRLVVHDAVKPALLDLDLLDDRQRLQIEHRHHRIAAVGGEAVAGFRRDARAVHSGRFRDLADDFAGFAVNDHHVRPARDEDAAGGRFDGDVIGSAIAFDVELFDFEVLRVSNDG